MTASFTALEKITGKIEFPDVFTSTGILVKITNPIIPEWRKVGYFKIEALIDGDFFNAQFRSIEFGNSLISIPYSAYRLTFEPIDSLLILHPNLSIQIAEFNLNMYVSPGELKRQEVGEPIYNTITATVLSVVGAIFSIAPVRSRRSALITNKTGRILRIKEGSATSGEPLVDADPFTEIAPGGSYSVEDFSGEILGLLGAGAVQTGDKIIVKELPYLLATPTTSQPIVTSGTLLIPFGSIAFANDGSSNIVWTAKTGESSIDGGAEELFVVAEKVYVRTAAGEHYSRMGDRSGSWTLINATLYQNLKSTATNIITPRPSA
jgi:hypothetical protein